MADTHKRRVRFLPSEIMAEILVRLPIKSLLRLRSTSKPIRDLIDNAKFRFLHCKHGMYAESSKLVVVGCSRNVVNANVYLKTAANDFTISKAFTFPGNFGNFKCEAVGQVNGLILLHKYVSRVNNWNSSSELIVWNPLTRETNTIPKSPLCCSALMMNQPASIAFGYDGDSKDYKIVVLIADSVSADGTLEYRVRAEIYSLNTKQWGSNMSSSGTDCLIIGPKVSCGKSILWLAGLPPDRMGRDNYDAEGGNFNDLENLEEDVSYSRLISVHFQNGCIDKKTLPTSISDTNEEPLIVRIPLIYNGAFSILINGCDDVRIWQVNGEFWHELSNYEEVDELNVALICRRVTNAILMDTNLGTLLLVSIHGGGMVSSELETGTTKRLLAGSDFVDLYVESLLSPSNPSGLT